MCFTVSLVYQKRVALELLSCTIFGLLVVNGRENVVGEGTKKLFSYLIGLKRES